MSDVNERLVKKYGTVDRIITDFYRVYDKRGNEITLDGMINPLRIDNRQMCSPTDNQGNLPACAGYSACTLVESLYWRMTGKVKQFNGDQCYAIAKTLDGCMNDEGTYLEYALKAVLGLCEKEPDFGFLKSAQIGQFFNSGDDVVELTKFLIHKYGIVQVGFNITTGWYRCNCDNPVLEHTSQSIGGHAVNLVGYEPDYVYILNQWGVDWGAKGYAMMSWGDYVRELMYGAYLYGITF